MMWSYGYMVIEDGTRFEIASITLEDEKIVFHGEKRHATRPAGPIGHTRVYGEDDSLVAEMHLPDVATAQVKNRLWPLTVSMRVNFTNSGPDDAPSWVRDVDSAT